MPRAFLIVTGQLYAWTSRENMFTTSEEDTIEVLQWILDEFPHKLQAEVFKQILYTVEGVSVKRRDIVMDAYGSVWDFFEADCDSLQELHQIGPQTAQAIIDRVEERTELASQSNTNAE